MAEKKIDPLDTSKAPDWWSWLMIALSLFFLIGYSVLILEPSMPAGTIETIAISMIVVWVIFLIEYVLSLKRSGQGWRFLSKHWLLTLSLVLPVFRPFVLLRYINQLKYFKGGSGGAMRLRIIVSATSFATLFIYVISLTVLRFERYAPGATIVSFGDAIWWAFVTIATVGYGDEYPITVPGRFFAVILMMGGVAIVGTASALVVSYLGEQTQKALKQSQNEAAKKRASEKRQRAESSAD